MHSIVKLLFLTDLETSWVGLSNTVRGIRKETGSEGGRGRREKTGRQEDREIGRLIMYVIRQSERDRGRGR